MKTLDGKIALVTGASRGIGRATALALGKRGAYVAVNFLSNEKGAEEVVAEIENSGGKAKAFKANVTDEKEVDGMIAVIEKDFGTVDILICNAAPKIQRGHFGEASWNGIFEQINVHCGGSYNVMSRVLPGMKAKKNGKIVGVLTSYLWENTPKYFTPYMVAKAALWGLFISVTEELASYGIQINMISPEPADTDLLRDLPPSFREIIGRKNKLGRLARPEEIAEAIAALVET